METFVLRISMAALVGFIIGIGSDTMKTAVMFAITCMGAALLSITSTEFYKVAAYPWMSDPGRLSAQIVSALGFIGTGLIWISEDKKVVGLSVATTLWITAILGILIGAGLENISVLAVFLVLIIYYLLSKLQKWKEITRKKLKFNK